MDKFDETIKNILIVIAFALLFIAATPILTVGIYLFGPLLNYYIKPVFDPELNYLMILLSGFGICIAIAGIAPFVIAKHLTQKDIDKAVETKINEQFNERFSKTLNLLQRSEADHSRMNSYLLYCADKPVWAIGWMARSLIRYQVYKHRQDENKDIKNWQGDYQSIVKLCIPTIVLCMKRFETKIEERKYKNASELDQNIRDIYNQDNHEEEKRVAIRAVSDLIDFLLGHQDEDESCTIDPGLRKEEKNAIDAFLKLLINSFALNANEVNELQKHSWHSQKGNRFKNKYKDHHDVVEDKTVTELYKEFQNKLKIVFENPDFKYTYHYKSKPSDPVNNNKDRISFLECWKFWKK